MNLGLPGRRLHVLLSEQTSIHVSLHRSCSFYKHRSSRRRSTEREQRAIVVHAAELGAQRSWQIACCHKRPGRL